MKPVLTILALGAILVLSAGFGGASAWLMRPATVPVAAMPDDRCDASLPLADCTCAAQKTRHILDAATRRIPGARYATAWDLAEAQLPLACRPRS